MLYLLCLFVSGESGNRYEERFTFVNLNVGDTQPFSSENNVEGVKSARKGLFSSNYAGVQLNIHMMQD